MIGRWLAFLLLCAGLLAAVPAVAQPGTDEQLAAQYFQNGDYERAALYYEKLYKRQPTPYYYDQYFKTLSALGEFERAEKLVKDQMKRTDDPKYLVDLGGLYREQGGIWRYEILGMSSVVCLQDPTENRVTASWTLYLIAAISSDLSIDLSRKILSFRPEPVPIILFSNAYIVRCDFGDNGDMAGGLEVAALVPNEKTTVLGVAFRTVQE